VTYDIQPLLDHGIDGRGETVTVLAPLPDPSTPAPAATDIREDLATFDRVNHLPTARIHVVTTLAGANSPWRATIEEAEDTEIAHAVAPASRLRVVLIPSTVLDSPANATADMLAGLRLAVSDTDVTSFSWGLGEHLFTAAQVTEMHSILTEAAAHHVTVIAASGDHGAISDPDFGTAPVKEVSLPASDPLVLAAGGTTLTANRSTGAYLGETAWNSPPATAGGHSGGSGGGFSHLHARPGYQNGVPTIGAAREVPDVAGDADPQTGMALAVMDGGQNYILGSASGTSAATPLWGGLIALANQYAGRDLGFVNPALYGIARGPQDKQAFHDITTGNNTAIVGSQTIPGYPAVPGWDAVTGWGSPNASVLVPLLAHTPVR
jgi:subtilase family serine protease